MRIKTFWKIYTHFILAAIFGGGLFLHAASAQPIGTFTNDVSPLPAPTGFVNDYTGMIDPAAKDRMEAQLRRFKESSNPSVEIGVAVIKTTGDRPIFDYSLAVARGWGIGSKAADNPGALLLIAIDDRKYFTQVSRDLEDELPDGLTGSLQRQYLVPEFKKGNYSKGIEDTIGAYIRTIEARRSGQELPEEVADTDGGSSVSGSDCRAIGVIALMILIILIIARTSGGGRRGGGSGGGSDVAIGVLGAIISGFGSGGGDSSSGGWGGGGGGFGGGGDFGGGGAGGSW